MDERALPYLFLFILLVQTLWPITYIGAVDGRSLPNMILLYQLLAVAQMVLGILSARDYRKIRHALMGLGALWGVTAVISFFLPSASWPLLVGYLIVTIFQFGLVAMLSVYILKAESITTGVLLAASAVYLLIGSIFMPIYDSIETITFMQTGGHHAFSDNVTQVGETFPWQTLIYYSTSVLTTVGFGDVIPLSPWARAVTQLQALLGVLYLTFVVARLVSLFSTPET